MSKKANPTIIGSFTLGGLALVVIGLIVFGSGQLFAHRPRAVSFFHGQNLQGLRVGASVNLRGVQVGTVTEIILQLDPKTMTPLIPVYMAFDTKALTIKNQSIGDLMDQKPLKTAIANGLHARLATESLVTGQLIIELDLDPDEPRSFVGADAGTVEIPTSQSDLEKFKNTLLRLPLDDIAASALRVLDDVHKLASSPEIAKLLSSLVSLSDNANDLVTSARGDLGTITSQVDRTAGAARDALAIAPATLTAMQTALTTVNQLMKTDVNQAIIVAVRALQKAEKLMTDADGLVAANSAQRYDIDQTLRNLTAASRSLRSFSEELERKPNAIVLGK